MTFGTLMLYRQIPICTETAACVPAAHSLLFDKERGGQLALADDRCADIQELSVI